MHLNIKVLFFSGGLNIVLNYMDINGNGFASLLINWYCEGMLNIAFPYNLFMKGA